MGLSGQRHAPAALYLRERTLGTHCTEGWVGLRACLDTEARGKILCLCRRSKPGRSIQILSWVNTFTERAASEERIPALGKGLLYWRALVDDDGN
jgi:hypothetical protein